MPKAPTEGAAEELDLFSSEAKSVTQFSLTDVRPVGSINNELRVFTDFLPERRENIWFTIRFQIMPAVKGLSKLSSWHVWLFEVMTLKLKAGWTRLWGWFRPYRGAAVAGPPALTLVRAGETLPHSSSSGMTDLFTLVPSSFSFFFSKTHKAEMRLCHIVSRCLDNKQLFGSSATGSEGFTKLEKRSVMFWN